MAHLDPTAVVIERLRDAIELLESIAADRSVLSGVPDEERKRLLQAVANVYSPDRVERRRMSKVVDRQRKAARVKGDQGVLHETGIRSLRRKPVFHTPNVFPTVSVADGFEPRDVHGPPKTPTRQPKAQRPEPKARQSKELQHCYVCKQKYSVIHHFYDQLCPSCAELNFTKRTELADLRGRVALLTGGRVKIGYQAGLKLLRCGAHLIVTTRFPRDSANRYAREPDFGDWGHRLEIFGLDLRHTPSVEAFCRELLATQDSPRLHRQQRVPDGASSAGFLRAHDGGRDGCAARHAGARAQAARVVRGAAWISPAAGGRRNACRQIGRAPSRRDGPHARRAAVAGAAAPRRTGGAEGSVSRRQTRSGPAADRPARPELVAAAAPRGVVRGAARGAAGERGRALHHQRAPQAADAPHARARQAHRQRVGRGRAVLPATSRRRGIRTRTWRRRRST